MGKDRHIIRRPPSSRVTSLWPLVEARVQWRSGGQGHSGSAILLPAFIVLTVLGFVFASVYFSSL